MQRDHAFQKDCLCTGNRLDGLPRHRLGQKANKIARMSGLQCHANLAISFEPPNSRTMAGTRVNDHEGSASCIDFDALRGDYPSKSVVCRWLKFPTVDD